MSQRVKQTLEEDRGNKMSNFVDGKPNVSNEGNNDWKKAKSNEQKNRKQIADKLTEQLKKEVAKQEKKK